jgi:hypothetical protein
MTDRPDFATLDPDLAATLGLYETHRFCLRLGPSTSLVDADGNPKRQLEKEVLVLLMHEYTHYLHNLSTPTGFTAYQLFQQMLGSFSHALKDDGTCDPSLMPPEAGEQLRNALDALAVINGASALPRDPSPAVQLRVLGVSNRALTMKGVDILQAEVRWAIERRDGSREEVVLPAGAVLVQEGIAFLLEEFVRLGRVTFDMSGVNPPPLYPYVAFRTLVSSLAPDASALSAVRIGTMALCTNRPGATLVHSLKAYQKMRTQGADDRRACEIIRDSLRAPLDAIVQRICSVELAELATMHLERGIVGTGHAVVLEDFRNLLTRRSATPWWDLDWCQEDGSVDNQRLSQLLLSNVPCDVIQERDGDPNAPQRDVLLTFKKGGIEQDDGSVLPTDADSGVRAVHAQMDYLLAHLVAGGIRSTRKPSPRKCPFFTSCRLELRTTEAEVCRDEPWRRFTPKGWTCWYGVGVAATLGLLKPLD